MGRIARIAVIGAGTMGHGIAEIAAISGYNVVLMDIAEEFLENALRRIKWSLGKLSEKGRLKESVEDVMSRITTTLSLEEAAGNADLIIEAVPEKMELKKNVFSRADKAAPPHTIIATNTSSLPVSELAAATQRPDKVIGIHFFNPPVIMRLVEIIRGEKTSSETVETAKSFVESLGKKPILVSKDIPGFVVNRILVRLLNEGCRLVHAGEASIEEVDATARYKLGFPMGVFELLDYSGIDVFYLIMKAMKERGVEIHICPLLEEKYRENSLGVKTGKGFYQYPEPGRFVKPALSEDKAVVDPVSLVAPPINEAAWILGQEVASKEDIDVATELGLGWPKGVFKLADEIGLDRIMSSLEKLWKKTGWKEYSPHPMIKHMVEEGMLGVKTGKGFYQYGEVRVEKIGDIAVKVEPPIAWIILSRPSKLNALTLTMLEDLDKAVKTVLENDEVRAVILSGEGRAFCAGADVSGFKNMNSIDAYRFSRRFQEILLRIDRSPKPFIAAINGYALGGGLELALACDLRIASSEARLGQPEINLGFIPGAGATQRLPRIIGVGRALELVMTGDMIGAEEAYRIGLINKIVPPERLEEEARRLALKLAEKPPIALQAAKRAVKEASSLPLEEGLKIEAELFGLLFATEDAHEGVDAFLSKRKPQFKGK